MQLAPWIKFVILLLFVGVLGYNRIVYRQLAENEKPHPTPTIKLDIIPLSKLPPGQYRVLEKISRVPTKKYSKMDWLTIKVQDITESFPHTTHVVQMMQLGNEDDAHLVNSTFIKNVDGSTFQAMK
ncbi:MAG: hypothetical protein V4686_01520 [Patescibacteria group bacterium]